MKTNHSINDYLLFFEAWTCLAAARLAVVTLPFRKIAPYMGIQVDDLSFQPRPEAKDEKLHSIRCAINRAAARSPWRTKCLEQAIAARTMLQRRGEQSTIFLGVAPTSKQQKSIAAHAWLMCNGEIVTGKKGVCDFTVIGKFK